MIPRALTPRHHEVMALLVQGMTNKAIARRLGVAPQTVKSLLWQIYRVLDVDNRTSAAVVYLSQNRPPPFS